MGSSDNHHKHKSKKKKNSDSSELSDSQGMENQHRKKVQKDFKSVSKASNQPSNENKSMEKQQRNMQAQMPNQLYGMIPGQNSLFFSSQSMGPLAQLNPLSQINPMSGMSQMMGKMSIPMPMMPMMSGQVLSHQMGPFSQVQTPYMPQQIQVPNQEQQQYQFQKQNQGNLQQNQQKQVASHQPQVKERKDFTEIENFLCFKNLLLTAGLPEVLKNLHVNQEHASKDLIIKVCLKAIHQMKERLKFDPSLKEIEQKISENVLQGLHRQAKDEMKSKKKSKKEHKGHFNTGIPNSDFQILKLLHENNQCANIFRDILHEKENPYQIDLSYFSQKLIDESLKEKSNDLYQNAVKLFKGAPTRKLTA